MGITVTIFGGARSKPGEPAYEEALKLGRLLGSAGYRVVTGGYIGAMEAISRGAAEAGGHVIGVTCDEIESYRKVRPNPWVQEEIRSSTMPERLKIMIEASQAILALPGGAGTLMEITTTWNHLLTGAIPPRPLILIGLEWQSVFDTYFRVLGNYVTLQDRTWLIFTPDVDAAFKRVIEYTGKIG